MVWLPCYANFEDSFWCTCFWNINNGSKLNYTLLTNVSCEIEKSSSAISFKYFESTHDTFEMTYLIAQGFNCGTTLSDDRPGHLWWNQQSAPNFILKKSQYFRLFNGHDMTYRMSHTGHVKNKYAIVPTRKDGIFFHMKENFLTFSVLLLLLSSILVGWSDWLTNIGGWIVGGLGFSPVVVDWSPGSGSDRELFTLPCFIDDATRAFLYAPEFVRYDRTGGPGIWFVY